MISLSIFCKLQAYLLDLHMPQRVDAFISHVGPCAKIWSWHLIYSAYSIYLLALSKMPIMEAHGTYLFQGN